ncbi:MAG: hypothetical protein DMF84_28815 [Acidobacteria bacterium]|nr:MAG: hypothetical protein DMF84_28815 [Acidobacteriota bacterium]
MCEIFVLLASATPQADPGAFIGQSHAVSVSDAVLTEPPASGTPTFRLGNAGRPFGSSTVIGDFDTDGNPDVAVADHLGQLPSGYEYRIDFSVSGQAPGCPA